MNSESTEFLIEEYVRRKNLNYRYSERAFAKALGLSPGFLKQLFQGKKRLSFQRAKVVANKLTWTESRKSQFLQKVQSSSARNSRALSGKVVIRDKDFFEVSDWFHFAIVELLKSKDGAASIEEICQRLVISKTEAMFALKHLARLNIIEELKESHYRVPQSYEVPSTTSQGIRKYHKQMLSRAIDAVDAQTPEDRDLRGLTLAFEKARLEEAKKEIQKFVAQFEKKFGQGPRDSVYQLSLSLYRLDKEES